MPPFSLHHFANALAVSTISLLRPDRPVKPLSVTVPMWISVSVTPLSVAPFASPGAQTFVRSPKPPAASDVSPPLDALPLVDFDESDDAVLVPPPRLHNAATSTSTNASAAARYRFISCSPRLSVACQPPR